MTRWLPRDTIPGRTRRVAVTVDVVTFTIVDEQLQILLVRRGQDPYEGRWALPGGFVRDDEDLEAAALRELQEETGVIAEPRYLEQLGTYGRPDRDPRMRVVTVAYWAILANLPEPHGGGDAADARLFPVVMIEADALELAFDHDKIIKEAVERVRSKLEYTTLAARFCPPEFTISPVAARLRSGVERSYRTGQLPSQGHQQSRLSPVHRRPYRSERRRRTSRRDLPNRNRGPCFPHRSRGLRQGGNAPRRSGWFGSLADARRANLHTIDGSACL